MTSKGKIAAVGLAAVALTGLVGVGVSYADDPTPTAQPSATPSATPGAERGEHARRPLLKRALHGEVTVGGKQTRVIAFQRGEVLKVSTESITVRSVDDFTATYVVTTDTKVRQAGEPGEVDDLRAGDRVRVAALKDGDTLTARVIGEPRER